MVSTLIKSKNKKVFVKVAFINQVQLIQLSIP